MSAILQEVPEGEYLADIVEMTSAIDGKNRKVVTWTLKMADSPFEGCILLKKFYVINAKVSEFLKRELRLVGVEANNNQEFETKKEQAYGTRMRLTATTNDQGFRVYYVKEVVGKGDGPAPAVKSEDVGW